MKNESESLIKLDVGCGDKKRRGYIGIDITRNHTDADIVRDVDKHGLPFSDNTAIAIWADNVIEHMENLIFVMNECQRVLVPKRGRMYIIVPYKFCEGALTDPTHRQFFTSKTFSFFVKGKRQKQYGIRPWKVLRTKSVDGHIHAILEPHK